LIDDVFDLLKFDQGTIMEAKDQSIPTRTLCLEVLSKTNSCSPQVTMELEICDGVPSQINCDIKILKRLLLLILNNACDASTKGKIELIVSSDFEAKNYTFTVVYKERGNKSDSKPEEGKKPLVFQRHHEELPNDTVSFEEAINLRRKIEQGLSCCRTNSIGVNLPLSYHLAQTLGAELKYESKCGVKLSDLSTTKVFFNLPPYEMPFLSSERITKDFVSMTTLEQSRNVSESCVNIKPFKMISFDKPQDIPEPVPSEKITSNESKDNDETKIPVEKVAPEIKCGADKIPSVQVASEGLKAGQKPHVLVVEDTDICAKLICMILRKLNYSTERAENGQVALDLLRAADPGMFSLVLMDLRMPVMDGFEATKAIKKYLKLDVPVVALTGETSYALQVQCEEIGFDGFYQKPLKRKQLEEVVKKYTDSKAESSEEQ